MPLLRLEPLVRRLRDAIRAVLEFDYDPDMPKVEGAFDQGVLGNEFQKEFDKWKAESKPSRKAGLRSSTKRLFRTTPRSSSSGGWCLGQRPHVAGELGGGLQHESHQAIPRAQQHASMGFPCGNWEAEPEDPHSGSLGPSAQGADAQLARSTRGATASQDPRKATEGSIAAL